VVAASSLGRSGDWRRSLDDLFVADVRMRRILASAPETADMVGGRWVEHLAARTPAAERSQHVARETGAFAASVVSGIVGPAQTRQATVEVTKDSNPIQGNGCGCQGLRIERR
jgi:hypothetical protein